MKRLQDFSLNIKVLCIALIAVLIVAGITGTGIYFYSRIERDNFLKNNISAIEKNIIETIVTEKTWLQFFSPEMKRSLDGKVDAIESDIQTLQAGKDMGQYQVLIEKQGVC